MDTSPRQLGPYLLEEELGRGAMGVVYRARDTRVDRVVAIKLVLTEGETQAKRFETEARAAAGLNHKNLVTVHDLAREGSRVYLVTEFVEGRSLKAHIKERGRFEPEEAVALMIQLCDGVEHAHQAGVLHRDIKPENVLLEGKEPRLADFGLARVGESNLTQTGQLLGTPSYMPPEQASGERELVGPCSDVYSLGATLYALLTGQPPFSAGSPIATVTAVLTKPPPPPSELAPIPPELEAIVLQTLAKEPEDRFPSAAALGQALRDWQAGVVNVLVKQGQSRVQRGVVVAGVGAVLIAGGFGLWAATRFLQPPTQAKLPQPVATSPPPQVVPPGEFLKLGEVHWNGTEELDGDAALEAYRQALRGGATVACEPLAEVLVAGHGSLEDRARAQAALEGAAEAGSEEALVALARVYTLGRSESVDEAEPWCRKLLERGDARGLLWLGDLHFKKRKRELAEACFQEAIGAGDPEGKVRLGLLLCRSEKRQDEGVAYLHAAGEIASAAQALGEVYRRNGWGVRKDAKVAKRHYRLAIKLGSVEALYRLATLLERKKPLEFVALLEEASRKGHLKATTVLSRRFYGADNARYLRLARWAASRGHREALGYYAGYYLQGLGGTPEVERGLSILRLASERGDTKASRSLARELEKLGRGGQARALWMEQIKRGDSGAMADLGLAMMARNPTAAEREEALEFLHEAAKRYHPDIAIRLGRAYELGSSDSFRLKQDYAMAKHMYELGRRAGAFEAGARLKALETKVQAE